jgi:N-acetylglucosaminyldiphosphoundecaprenol N-acetyl-beta-D-mannosaminyltransferase
LDHESLRDQIRAARPDIVLVAMGCPKQEKFISMNYRELDVPCSIGVGAGIDFLAGRFPRAPEWMKQTGTEWLFRLVREPRRLLPRYGGDFLFYFPALAAQLVWNGKASSQPAAAIPASCLEDGPWYTWSGRVDEAALGSCTAPLPLPNGSRRPVVVALEAVESIDAVGLGALLHAWKVCQDDGGGLVLYRPSSAVRRPIEAFRLDRILRVVFEPEEAKRISTLVPGVPSIKPSYNGASRKLRLDVSGELTARGVSRCRTALFAEWHRHPDAEVLEIDLEDLFFIDSAGVALLLDADRVVRQRRGGLFRLLRPSSNVCNVIECGDARILLDLS